MSEPTNLECTCKITGPDYDQTKFDPECPFHGKNGAMVSIIHAPLHRLKGGMKRRCPHCGRSL